MEFVQNCLSQTKLLENSLSQTKFLLGERLWAQFGGDVVN